VSVVHCKKETFDVYIGRPSNWGNPFVIGRDGTREEVIAKYRNALWNKIKQNPELESQLAALHGKTLGCYCAPHACHGDVLVAAANYFHNIVFTITENQI